MLVGTSVKPRAGPSTTYMVAPTITTTVTKFGQVVDRTTRTQELGYTDAPASVADDSLALTREGRELCHFYGLTRGMIVSVECPPTQADAGAQLFRTVVQRIRDI